jgi:hypothetical protein
MLNRPVILAIALLGCLPVIGAAEPQKYNFNNPTFGGSPFMSNHLLNLAIKQYELPTAQAAPAKSELEAFQDSVRSRTLSSLASVLAANIRGLTIEELAAGSGENPIDIEGLELVYGSVDDGCSINVSLSDGVDESINFTVPNFANEGCE